MQQEQKRVHSELDDVTKNLINVLRKSLRLLGENGPNDEACLLAAEAWSVLRHQHPKEAERFNGLLHYLTSTKCKQLAAERK